MQGYKKFWPLMWLFFSSVVYAEEKLTVYTEEFPPYNYFSGSGEARGIGVDLVRELVKRSGIDASDLSFKPWATAYKEALEKPNVMIFSVLRSERREKQFHWIGEIMPYTVYLYQLRERKDIKLSALENAAQYRVGGVKRWDTSIWLKEKHIPVLELNFGWQGLQMMKVKRLDLMPYSSLSLSYDAARHGYKTSDFLKAIKLRESSLQIALSKATDQKIARQLQATYKAIRADGTYQRIVDRYVYLDLYDKPRADLVPPSVDSLSGTSGR